MKLLSGIHVNNLQGIIDIDKRQPFFSAWKTCDKGAC